MKKHYYIEVALLLLLSIAAATLAADHHFYDLVWELFHLQKDNFEDWVARIRLFGFTSIIILSILSIWKHLHSERRIVGSLLAAVHKVIFKNINLTDTTSDTIHRITCHKYYSFSWLRTIAGYNIYFLSLFFFGESLLNNVSSVSKIMLWFIAFLLVSAVCYVFLKVIDGWWYQFWQRFFRLIWRKRKWSRILIPGRNYCLSYARFGYETGRLNTSNTTIPARVSRYLRLSKFGWLIYLISIVAVAALLKYNFDWSSSWLSYTSLIWTIIPVILVTTIFGLYSKLLNPWLYRYWCKVFRLKQKDNKWIRRINKVNTSLPFLVNSNAQSNRLFTGMVFDSNEEIVISKDHNGINDLLRKFNEERKKDSTKYSADNDAFRTNLKYPVNTNIAKIREVDEFKNSLTQIEQGKVIDFMKSTNTLAFDLFDINKIGHCEHFLGFKIRGKNNTTWGVVVIDVLSNTNQTFYEYLGFQNDEDWLKLFLSSYSELFSKTIITGTDE